MGFEPPMNGPIQDADTLHAGSIKLVDATNGKRLPHELPLLSSAPFGWRGIVVEWHRLKPQEMPEHYVDGHGLAVSTGVNPYHSAGRIAAGGVRVNWTLVNFIC